MRCPKCEVDDTKVIDSREASEGTAIRRRRSCVACQHRFTTYERLEEIPLVVLKTIVRPAIFSPTYSFGEFPKSKPSMRVPPRSPPATPGPNDPHKGH